MRTPDPDLPIPEVVLDILCIEGPSTTQDVARHLRFRLGQRVAEDRIAAVLLALSESGRVRRDGGSRWKALDQPTPRARQTRAADPSAAPALVSGMRTSVVDSAPSQSQETGPPGDFQPLSDEWALFRKLCLYYIACLREDGAPALSAFPERRGSSWLSFRGVPPWERLETGEHLGFHYSLRPEEADFAKNGLRGRNDESLFLAYPCQWVVPKSKDKSPFLLPILVWPLDVTWDLVSLHCRSDGHYRLNGRWLEGQFRSRAEARSFVDAIGLADGTGSRSFSEVVERVARFLHKDLAEPLVPGRPTSPPKEILKLKAGVYNWPILLRGKRLKYTGTLVRELKRVARAPKEDLAGSALGHLFGNDSPAAGIPKSEDNLLELKILNAEQRTAVRAMTTGGLAAVTGPPGTGKSEVARAAIVNQCLAGRSVLLASKNHRAIDAVAPVLNALVDGRELVRRPQSGGERGAWFSWSDLLHGLLNAPTHGFVKRYDARLEDLQAALKSEERLLHSVRERLELAEALAQAHLSQEEATSRLPVHLRELAALDGLEFPDQPGLDLLRVRLEELTATPSGLWGRLRAFVSRKTREEELRALLALLSAFPAGKENPRSMGIESGAAAAAFPWDLWRDLRSALDRRSRVDDLEAGIRGLTPADQLDKAIDSSRQRTRELALSLLRDLAEGNHANLSPALRTSWTNLAAAAANFGEGRVRKELRERFPSLLRHFPAWAVTNLSVGSTFPLAPGIFDLLVVDEASQCDIPSVIPLLFRSRRATFIGDPMQLRHVTSISATREEALLRRYELTSLDIQRFTYRENSAFSLVRSTPGLGSLHFLADHYRSHESIAGFFNRSFYKEQLNIATTGRSWRVPRGRRPGIHWTDVRGEIESPGSGAFCSAEIETVVAELKDLERVGFDGSIGIVTPFRMQADRIRDRVTSSFSASFLERAELEVGSAHAFQGGERDLMLFSLCCGPGMAAGKTAFATRQNLFNVAVSRARAILHVVGNAEWARSSGVAFVMDLSKNCGEDGEDGVADRIPSAVYESPWEKRFHEALKAAGLEALPQYPVAGRRLDFAIVRGETRLDLEVDGEAWHRGGDGHRKADDLWRDHQLRALGWTVLRFWVYELREDMKGCIARVEAALRGGS